MDPSFDVDAFLHEILPQISGETCYEEFTELRVINEYPRYSYEIQDTWQNQDTVSIEYEFGGTAIVENIVADGKQKTKKKNSKMGKEDTKKLIQNRKAAKKLRDKKKSWEINFGETSFTTFAGKTTGSRNNYSSISRNSTPERWGQYT